MVVPCVCVPINTYTGALKCPPCGRSQARLPPCLFMRMCHAPCPASCPVCPVCPALPCPALPCPLCTWSPPTFSYEGFPPALVLERGKQTLTDWLKSQHPDSMLQRTALHQVWGGREGGGPGGGMLASASPGDSQCMIMIYGINILVPYFRSATAHPFINYI